MAVDVYDAYRKAQEAWLAVPKEMFRREYFGEFGQETCRLSCPTCGIVFAEFTTPADYTFNEPVFCCGKLLR